jgi:hypothetical protein
MLFFGALNGGCAAFLCVICCAFSPKNYHFFYCLLLGEIQTLGNNAFPVLSACFSWLCVMNSARCSDLCTKVVPLQSVTVLARAGKKFTLMQEFVDFLHK